jgi:hypothetical protein
LQYQLYHLPQIVYTSSVVGTWGKDYEQMGELGWQEVAGLATGGGLGALLCHGYLKWVKPWLAKLR